ncbi:MAG: hypothetical protein LBD37_03065 [Treponema sp.]|nr:hypothetical protein [Treponema sp.]
MARILGKSLMARLDALQAAVQHAGGAPVSVSGGACGGTCSGGCKDSCSGDCYGGCRTGCDGGCKGGCANTDSNACYPN